MDDVLGVVREDHFEADGVLLFEEQHALVDPVEAVGFGCGAFVWNPGEMHIGEAFRGFGYGGESRGVVGIGADKDVVVRVAQRGHVLRDHALDDAMLFPQRNEDGHGALVSGGRRGRVLAAQK